MPFPIREIYHADNPKVQSEQISDRMTKNLESIPVLVRMEPDSLEDIARGAILQNFAAGEEVIREGEPVKALHLILAGKAGITVKTPSGKVEEIFYLGRGDFFRRDGFIYWTNQFGFHSGSGRLRGYFNLF